MAAISAWLVGCSERASGLGVGRFCSSVKAALMAVVKWAIAGSKACFFASPMPFARKSLASATAGDNGVNLISAALLAAVLADRSAVIAKCLSAKYLSNLLFCNYS